MDPVCADTALPFVVLLSTKVVAVGEARTGRALAVNVVMPVMLIESPATRPCATLVV
jgi:hypothetical protein